MSYVKNIQGRGIPLLLDDIDTDRIIPARYLRCVTFDGLGEHAFEDDRQQDGQHPFDDARFAGASVLVVGRNFGCGSSREHAPQSLMRWGIKAIVGESFAEIFFGNCTSLGIPCVRLARAELDKIADTVRQNPRQEITIDLQARQVQAGGATYSCEMPDNARQALLTGEYDALVRLLEATDEIRQKVTSIPYMTNFAKT